MHNYSTLNFRIIKMKDLSLKRSVADIMTFIRSGILVTECRSWNCLIFISIFRQSRSLVIYAFEELINLMKNLLPIIWRAFRISIANELFSTSMRVNEVRTHKFVSSSTIHTLKRCAKNIKINSPRMHRPWLKSFIFCMNKMHLLIASAYVSAKIMKRTKNLRMLSTANFESLYASIKYCLYVEAVSISPKLNQLKLFKLSFMWLGVCYKITMLSSYLSIWCISFVFWRVENQSNAMNKVYTIWKSKMSNEKSKFFKIIDFRLCSLIPSLFPFLSIQKLTFVRSSLIHRSYICS